LCKQYENINWFTFGFTEVGKGYITPWDLERMATINDFIWTDSEISKMIRCFDSDGDGKVCLCFLIKLKYQSFSSEFTLEK
jgi:Ca2+-binding EF-hand superfamily protein